MSSNKKWEEFEANKDKGNRGLARLAQKHVRGFSDDEIWNLRDAIISFVTPRMSFFTKWQCEHGKYTPPQYSNHPDVWLNILNKIDRAFEMANDPSYPWDDSSRAEVQEGFELFGKYLTNLIG